MTVIVNGAGRKPNPVMLVGEAPGREESNRGKPFVGKSGAEQEAYLRRHGLSASLFYRTNVVKEYRDGNPDPTPEQISEWTPTLLREIEECEPRLIVAVGRFAARFFLGESADLEMVHGIPHRSGAFDPSRSDRGRDATIVPVYHPALGLYETDTRQLIDYDYTRVAATLADIKRDKRIVYPRDEFAGKELYDDVTGTELAEIVEGEDIIAIDTEGYPSDPWSLQVSCLPGTGYILRASWSDFAAGIRALQAAADQGATFLMHNLMWDVPVLRAMRLDLYPAKIWDNQYASYLLRRWPQGLKPLSYRCCGMLMDSYEETVGDVGLEKQLDYLSRVLERSWEKPEPRVIVENDGRMRLYQPQSIERAAERILLDYYSKKVNKDGERTDPYTRWGQVDRELRTTVERELGKMPIGTLADIPKDKAVRYACRDADATLRDYYPLRTELEKRGLLQLMLDGMEVAPVFEEMQATGMPASRVYFEQLEEEMLEITRRIGRQISREFFGGRPFNPNSPKQVNTLLRRRGLRATKKTSTGEDSTSKPSIEYLRYVDPAFALVFNWREHRHIIDSYCAPVLDRIPEGADFYPIRCRLKTTRTATRRLASADPNLLAIPVRTEHGRKVRSGYRYPDDSDLVLGAWDLSQIEARVMAHESRDRLLCRLFAEGRDVHTETASRIFDIPLDRVDKMKHRLPAKNTLFGIVYGIGGPGLKTQLWKLDQTMWTDESCQELIDEWFKLYPGVAEYIDAVAAKVRRNKESEVRDHWEMPRYLPAIWCNDNKLVAEAERHAVSQKIQGTAQGMIQNSIRHLRPIIHDMQESGERVHWNLQVHDEIVLSFARRLWPTINPIILDALTNHSGIALRVPVLAEGHMATNWGELK